MAKAKSTRTFLLFVPSSYCIIEKDLIKFFDCTDESKEKGEGLHVFVKTCSHVEGNYMNAFLYCLFTWEFLFLSVLFIAVFFLVNVHSSNRCSKFIKFTVHYMLYISSTPYPYTMSLIQFTAAYHPRSSSLRNPHYLRIQVLGQKFAFVIHIHNGTIRT